MKDYNQLSKLVSYVLRHAPWEYELELDDQGWVKISDLLSSVKSEAVDITIEDVKSMIDQSSKQRHEIKGEEIRALYGHSIPNKLIKEEGVPPDILYHGTSKEAAKIIMNSGLQPMSRQYVHLSIDEDMAKTVGNRKGKDPVILIINAKEALSAGVKFYIGNDRVWLADEIQEKFIILR